ncbi:MAG: hypothetical protein WCO53_03460 [Deltaproteobacteria bacterium]|jgi:hypothetical protein
MSNQTRVNTQSWKDQGIANPMMEDKLGRVLRPSDMADYLGLDEKTVRLYYPQLGGIRLGRRILFFEKEVINAIQKRSKMGSPSESKWQEEGKSVPKQEGCDNMGKRESVKSRGDMAREDKHGVIV